MKIDEFDSLGEEFFTKPITFGRKLGNVDRFAESSETESWTSDLTTGFWIFGTEKSSFGKETISGTLAQAEGYALFLTSRLIADGLTDSYGRSLAVVGDRISYQGIEYEIVQVVPLGPAEEDKYVLQKFYFKTFRE